MKIICVVVQKSNGLILGRFDSPEFAYRWIDMLAKNSGLRVEYRILDVEAPAQAA